MSFETQTQAHLASALSSGAEVDAAEVRLQWIETALLAGGTGIAVCLVAIVSVLIHLS